MKAALISALGLAALAFADDDVSDHHTTKTAPPAYITPTVKLTTSTIYTTSVSTIISCPPVVHSCPAESTVYTTVTIAVSTTVCPVTETPAPPPTYPAAPPPAKPTYPAAPPPAAQPPAPPAAQPPAPPAAPPAVGTVTPVKPTPTKPTVVVTAGAAPLQRAGGALAAVAIAAALI